jgi:hypothetical protein
MCWRYANGNTSHFVKLYARLLTLCFQGKLKREKRKVKGKVRSKHIIKSEMT